MKNYFIFSDVDGTLFSHSQACIPTSAINMIQQVRKMGHKVFISTGRGIHMLAYDDYKIDVDGYILCNGSHILIDGHNFYNFMDPDDLKKILDVLIQHKIGFLLEGKETNYLFENGFDVIRDFERKCINCLDLSDERTDESLASHHVINFNCFNGDYHEFLKLNVYFHNHDEVDLVLSQLGSHLHAIYDSKDSAPIKSIEIIAKGNSKAVGIDKILAYYHHPLSLTIALGDGKNDLEMIQHVAIGIAMGNGCDILKENADFISKDIDENGFEYALRKVLM
ncbi:MAG: HAD-IIB family hydrolase [Traorella sp.]